jgi:hypothetical protein
VADATKTADRPHRWTVALSLLAAFISLSSAAFSYLSLKETRENRRINEETSRAYLSVSSLVLDTSLFAEKNWENKSAKGFVTVANTGRVAAKQIDTLLDLNPPQAEEWFNIARFAEIPPGSSKTVRVFVSTGNKRSLTSLGDSGEYVVTVQLVYADGFHNERQEQSVTFCLPAPTKISKSINNLYPCDVHFGYGKDADGNNDH